MWIDPRVLGCDVGVSFSIDSDGSPESMVKCLSPTHDMLVLVPNGDRGDPSLDLSLNMLFDLEKKNVSLLPPQEKYMTLIRELRQDPTSGSVKWSSFMNKSDYREFVRGIITSTARTLHSINKSYFLGTWRTTIPVFESLREPVVDVELLSRSSDATKNTLSKATVGDDGVCDRIVYDRNGTRTGRLKVHSGINVLTFPKEHRDVFKSIYRNGSIVSIDFKSIEARVAWHLSGEECVEDDIYEMINERYFRSMLERRVVKYAVLSLLYGQGPESISRSIGCSVDNARKFISIMKKKFGVDEIVKRLSVQLELEGAIRNAYGRKVLIEKEGIKNVYNSYVQSTSVDAVMLGLLDLIDRLHRDIRPLFVIHDEVYVDCPTHLLNELSKNVKDLRVELLGMKMRLPTKVKVISRSDKR